MFFTQTLPIEQPDAEVQITREQQPEQIRLKMPNLTWTNETTPIKQSGCVMLALFANWFYAIALGGLYFLCGKVLSAAAYLAIFAVVTAAGSALLLRWVKKQGARIFAAL